MADPRLKLTKLQLLEKLDKLTNDFEQTVLYMNEGCICGRAPKPVHPVDPRLLKAGPLLQADAVYSLDPERVERALKLELDIHFGDDSPDPISKSAFARILAFVKKRLL